MPAPPQESPLARLVRLDGTKPIEIKPSDKSVWVCTCGLSRTFPLCDGSHKKCPKTEGPSEGEGAGKLHVYDRDRKRVVEVRDDT